MASRSSTVVRRRYTKPPVTRGGRNLFVAFGGVLLAVVVLLGLGVGGVGLGLYAMVAKDLPSPEEVRGLGSRSVALSTQVFDRKGRLLYEFFDPKAGRRTWVQLGEVSPYLINATVATEDASYFENQGINIRGMARALWSNVSHQEVQQGGSSITQQLVKNVFIAEEERYQASILRKVKEVILALELTRRYSKEDILGHYLNENNYGNLSYGVESAAQSYFGKAARDLDLAESAMLAGIPQAPARYSPFTNPDAAKSRQEEVITLMVRQGYVSQAEADRALAQELVYKTAKFQILAPHFVMYVKDLITEKYGARALYRSGLKVTTSLDLDLQGLGEEIVRDQVFKSHRYGAFNGSLVAIDPRTGEILSMVGSVDYFDDSVDGQVNIATAERQPGSSFKPFAYVTAFQKGWTPAKMLLDVPITIRDGVNPPYAPLNWDKKFAGPVSIRQALANSMNIPAVKTIEYTGVDAVLDTAHKMGITTLNRKGWYGLSLALGGGEVKLLDLTYAYGVFANQGKMAGTPVLPEKQLTGHRSLDPVAILKIEDRNGTVLEEFTAPQTIQVLPSEYAYLVTNILSDNVARAPTFGGTLQLPGPRPAAVKTGTTDNVKDFWTVGYTPELVTGVWMGNSDNKALTGGFSGNTIGPMWERFMRGALDGVPVTRFEQPPNIVSATVCLPSGLLPSDECQRTKAEIFVRGTVPTEKDKTWRRVGDQVMMVLPDEARAWAERSGGADVTTEGAAAVNVPAGPPNTAANAPARAQVLSPAPNAEVRGKLPVRVTVDGPGIEQWFVEIGRDGGSWVPIRTPRSDAVVGDVYADLDTAQLGLSGAYTVRLTVRRGGRVEQHTVPITVNNSGGVG